MLRELFPHGYFASPASGVRIAAVETALGVLFPKQLRVLYLETDGFREDRGHAPYLYPLAAKDSPVADSLLAMTRFNWEEAKTYWPQLDLTPFIFFGSASAGEMWGINWKQPDQIIAFSFHWEGLFEVVGSSIVEVYKADYSLYKL